MGDKVEVAITYLEQRRRPPFAPPRAPAGAATAVLKAERPPLAYYRFLYDLVGRQWHWSTRRRMDDDALASIVHDANVHVYSLLVGGAPGGFAEIDARKPDDVEITFFGLAQDLIGKGYGRHFFPHVVDLAWSRSVGRIRIETCTLDHPAALSLYQKAGFTVFDRRKGLVELRDDAPAMERTPHAKPESR